MGSLSGKSYSIFLSSTYEDLKPYRAAIIDALQRLRHVVVNMEQFGAKPDSPAIASGKEVTRANFFVSIVTNRYGTVDPRFGISASEIEYDTAVSEGLPLFIYIPDPNNPPNLPPARSADEEVYRQRFLAKIKGAKHFIFEEYSDPNDLAYMIAGDITNYGEKGEAEAEAHKGTLALLQRSYAAAIDHLMRARELNPSDGAIAFKCALALLRGAPPGTVREKSDIVRVEELLRAAMIALGAREVIVFWAAVKQDYWVRRWSYQEARDAVRTLLQRAQGSRSDPDLARLVRAVQPDVWARYAAYFG